ncbi:helix-turn-helix domain-containing protein [Devosia soli]|uniref:helix-turn-helix domain-containing protein n=1 Tax=Devosia soli TaxID=361041 RepID=UPI0009FF8667
MGLLTPKQVREMLNISDRQLRDLTEDGAIPFIDIGRGARRAARYDRADIEAFMAQRKRLLCRSSNDQAPIPTPTTSMSKVIDFRAPYRPATSARQKA